jgi:protein KTI12
MPLAGTNYLHELDKATQDIVSTLAERLSGAMPGDRVGVPGCATPVVLTRKPTLPELSRLRRQFLKVAKAHPGSETSSAGKLFVDYLNKELSSS